VKIFLNDVTKFSQLRSCLKKKSVLTGQSLIALAEDKTAASAFTKFGSWEPENKMRLDEIRKEKLSAVADC
jgi:hypothetical protein